MITAELLHRLRNDLPTTVNPRNNLAHCFSCKRNLNNIDLLRTLEYDFVAAVEMLERWLKEYEAKGKSAGARK